MDSLLKLITDKKKELQQFKRGTSISQRDLLNKEMDDILQRKREQIEAKQRESYKKLELLEKRLDRGNKKKTDVANDNQNVANNITKEITVEIYRKLRKLKLPIIIFGESPTERYDRLCRAEVGLAGSVSSDKNFNSETVTTVYQEIEHPIKSLGESSAEGSVKQKRLVDQDDKIDTTNLDCVKTSKICKWILKMFEFWEDEITQQKHLQKCDLGESNSRVLLVQTRNGIDPLLRLLYKNQLDASILEKLCKIIDCIEATDYRTAHDTYMLLAIGNAPWPMGVNPVDIQQRPKRSKIYTSEVAHVLNDDTTRKFIQMFKRLMTIAQRINPTSISKQVHMTTLLN